MKRIKVSLALLGLVVGTLTSFAFKTREKLTDCISGPATTSSQCGAVSTHLCCETAGHRMIKAVFNP